MPPAGNRMSQALSGHDSQWMANLDMYRLVYADALRTELAKRGRKCAIQQGSVYPDFYMIEYSLDCH